MELNLTHETETQIRVTCDGQHSHTFDLRPLILSEDQEEKQLLEDPASYGRGLYNALFVSETPARQALDATSERIILIATDNDLDAIPWEFLYGSNGFLVRERHFVRGLPSAQRLPPPTLDNALHIVAVPSNPLGSLVAPLNIDTEWLRLKEIVKTQPFSLTLERTRPPTTEQMRNAVANQRHCVVHFMGHGEQFEHGTMLGFEKENGELNLVEAKIFALRVRGTAFLVTLNACMSAAPGRTPFSNFAGALAWQRIPYALGMRFSILDDDARAFSRSFYNNLTRGSSVEEALLQARLTLAESPRSWVIGVPVLYTSLAAPATGFLPKEGKSHVIEHQPPMEVSALLRAEGGLYGRTEDLKQLGTLLTGDSRPCILTIHGSGGSGKTALAREVVERFAYAWPGGVWATTLENLPDRASFTNRLARFLGINMKELSDPYEVELQVLTHLIHQRTLIVLDNAETLVDAVETNNSSAIQLGQFLLQLPPQTVSLLITSRVPFGWSGEVLYELRGLSPKEGVDLFQSCVPQQAHEIDRAIAWNLSEKLKGHPLALRLLGNAFNGCGVTLHAFIEGHEAQLRQAQNKYRLVEHRHRSLYACIDISTHYLNADLYNFLSGLYIFHAPFLAQTAVAIFDPDAKDTVSNLSLVHTHLHTLWQRSLLERKIIITYEGTLHFYYLLPTTRLYVKQYMPPAYPHEALLARFGTEYACIVDRAFCELDRSATMAAIVQQTEEDIERGVAYVAGIKQGDYLTKLAGILFRQGASQRSLALLERALELAQGQEQKVTLLALNSIASVYQTIGQPQRALSLYEQALSITREVDDRTGEAPTLNNLASVYQTIGQPQRALSLYEQALSITREVSDRTGEATILNNLALVYQTIGQPVQALSLYWLVLHIKREVGDVAGEATTLNNLALAYQTIGQLDQALSYFEDALLITHEMRNRAEEAVILTNLAGVYQKIGQPDQALSYFEQALPIMREVGNVAREAVILDSLAGMYQVDQPQRALSLYEQALSITREVSDRTGEAAVLTNLAVLYRKIGQLDQALSYFEQALPIRREVVDRQGEVGTLNGLAYSYSDMNRFAEAEVTFEQSIRLAQRVNYPAGQAAGLADLSYLLYQQPNRKQEAMTRLEQALDVLAQTSLPQDAAMRTPEQLQHLLQAMRSGTPPNA